MIFFLIILLILVVFIAFNVNNSSDISFGFKNYTDVPIFVSLFIAFTAGVVVTIPMVLLSGRKKGPPKNQLQDKGTSKQKKGREDLPLGDDTPPIS